MNPEDRAVVESELEARPDLIPSLLQILDKSDLSKEQTSSVVAVIQVITILKYKSGLSVNTNMCPIPTLVCM